MENKAAEIIVDLYEIRAAFIQPLQARQMDKVHNVFQYNFFNVVIAQLTDKYKVSHEEI